MVWGDATFSEYKTRMSVAVAFAWLAWSVGVAEVGRCRERHIRCGELMARAGRCLPPSLKHPCLLTCRSCPRRRVDCC